MGISFQTVEINVADVLNGLTTDSNKWAGANIANCDSAISGVLTQAQNNGKFVKVWSAANKPECAVGQGTWAYLESSGDDGCGVLSNNASSADDDEVGLFSFYLKQDTALTAYVKYRRDEYQAKLAIEIDDTQVGSDIDMYNSSGAQNVTASTSLGTVAAGAHSLKIRANGHNGSSSGYHVIIGELIIAES